MLLLLEELLLLELPLVGLLAGDAASTMMTSRLPSSFACSLASHLVLDRVLDGVLSTGIIVF